MKTVSVAEAQTQLALLLRDVAAGEEIDLTDGDKRVARLIPPEPELRRIDWSKTWTEVSEVFAGRLAPGMPGSQVVLQGRR
jgi:antitoxin (DNA-binding transcriptional repressor) of toxin-antitoxin stability system